MSAIQSRQQQKAQTTYEQDFKVLHGLPLVLRNKVFPPSDSSLFKKKFAVERIKTLARYPAAQNACKAAGLYSSALSGDLQASGLPPTTNRGGKSQKDDMGDERVFSIEAKEFRKLVPIGRGKTEVVSVPLADRSKYRSYAFIDWVNFTFKSALFPLDLPSGHPALSYEDYVTVLSIDLQKIFGFGVDSKRETGLNFYEHTYNLPNGWGHICIGGQRDSVLVSIKGQGLMSAKPGWEKRLYTYLKTIPYAKITRVDLAHDNHYSKTSVDDYLEMYRAELFKTRGRSPGVECLGNWERPDGKGRTLYVGSRTSGKLLRVYEKGLQLANGFHDKYPDWLRVELELKNIDREIPFEVLLRPGQFLAGAYPALSNMHVIQDRIDTFKKTVKSTFLRSLETTRHQFGCHIWLQIQLIGVEAVVAFLIEGKDKIPKNFNFDTWEQLEQESFEFLHNREIKLRKLEDIPI